MTDKDLAVLAGTLPALIGRMSLVYAEMSSVHGLPMRPTEGLRTLARQQALYAQGRTTPGRIVTHADGLAIAQGGHGVSNHQARGDGYGYAIDSCFLGVDPYLDHHPDGAVMWQTFGACVRAHGLTWGGDWPAPLTDRPHVEWIG